MGIFLSTTAVRRVPSGHKPSGPVAESVSPGTGHAPARASEPEAVRIRTRNPRTQVLLGRLRNELGRIDSPPSSAAEAHAEISAAMTRARLGGWTLPALDAAGNHPQRDGSIVMPLVSHVIVFNPWGAFRIIDTLRPRFPYFEMASAEGRGFVLPWLRP